MYKVPIKDLLSWISLPKQHVAFSSAFLANSEILRNKKITNECKLEQAFLKNLRIEVLDMTRN